jgi:parallel beta-helix repeat protein
MKRKYLAVGIILLFIGTGIIPSLAQELGKPLPTSRGKWLYVGGSGPGNYTRIQDAINNASEGDIIFVFSGFYHEGYIHVDKSVEIRGENKTATEIDFSASLHCFIINADYVKISNFTMYQNSGTEFLGSVISVSGNYATISNNIFCPINSGRQIMRGINCWTHGSNLSGNEFFRTGCGIGLGMQNKNVVYNNIFNSPFGIRIWSSDSNIIYKNQFSCSELAIEITDSYFNNIIKNNFLGALSYFWNYIFPPFTHWFKNYWGKPSLQPHRIDGEIRYYYGPSRHWISFDFHPAQEPYEIPRMM